jgi:sugar lactone lactonase YvrE
MATAHTVGHGDYTYAVDTSWGRGPNGVPRFGVAQAVYGDSVERVYVFQRAPTAEMLVFDRHGALLNRWGEGQFVSPHGIWISATDEVYLTDVGAHTVTKWTTDGALLRTWGTPGTPGPPGRPFNGPSKAVLAPDGELYVSDGYGNRKVHRFDGDGELIESWGADGAAPGQFALVHDVWVDDRGRVLICDRENDRVQIFDRAGHFQTAWTGLGHPMQIFVRDDLLYLAHARNAISIRTLDGDVLASWPYESAVAGQSMSPHSLWVDSHGDIYVGEVTGENGFQKFTRQRG